MTAPHVSITAEKLFDLGPLPVTNSLLTTWIVMGFLLLLGVWLRLTLKKNPQGLQNLLEIVIESAQNAIDGITGDAKLTRKFFAVITTIFLFVLVNNWAGLLPGVGSIGVTEAAIEESSGHETSTAAESEQTAEASTHHNTFTPVFRPGSADLSFTLTLALIAVIIVQYHGISSLGLWGHLSKFINFHSPVGFFVGLLELVSEFAKVVSFSFRLFGNVFAGEVLLAVMISLVPFVVPMPFYAMEIFVGLVQAVVFAVLSLVFFKMATEPAHH